MKKYFLLAIFLFALIIRVYKLGIYPYGFHVDEVKAGWNAISILKTGFDDHHKILALYYNSFGDYRPTGIFYSIIPFILLFGKNVFAVRFSSSLFGALTIFPIFYLTLELTKNKKLAYISSLLLSILPWHIEVSRATSEVVISTFFTSYSIYFLLKLIKTNKSKYLFLNLIFILIAYLFYHAIRFLAPLFYLAVIINSKIINKKVIYSFLGVVLLSLYFSTTKEGLQRFDQVSIFKDTDISYEIQRINSEDKTLFSKIFDNKFLIYSKHFLFEYLDYFSPDFLIGKNARPYRYATPGYGLIGLTNLTLLTIGSIAIFKKKYNTLPLILLLIAPIPAALTTEDTPNLHRAFLMVPFITIITSYGLLEVYKYKKICLLLLISGFLLFSHSYFKHSLSHRPYLKNFFVDSPSFRNIGATELAMKLPELQNKYEKIIITNFPDNPYPWYVFFNNTNPKIFNQNYSSISNERVYQNIIFSEKKCPADDGLINYNHQNVLFIESWECPYEAQINGGYPLKVIDKIARPDESIVYVFLTRDINKPLFVNGKEIK